MIDVDDDHHHDDDFITSQEELLLIESNDDGSDFEITMGETVVEKVSRKRKAPTIKEPSKRKRTEKIPEQTSRNNLQCEICNTMFSRKDSLTRHIRNKHGIAYLVFHIIQSQDVCVSLNFKLIFHCLILWYCSSPP